MMASTNRTTIAVDAPIVALADEIERLLERARPLEVAKETLHAEWYARADAAQVALGSDAGIEISRSIGLNEVEQISTPLWHTIGKLQAEQQSMRVETIGGIFAKARVLRSALGPEFCDDIPRDDQDWHVLLFNEFMDALAAMAGNAGAK